MNILIIYLINYIRNYIYVIIITDVTAITKLTNYKNGARYFINCNEY